MTQYKFMWYEIKYMLHIICKRASKTSCNFFIIFSTQFCIVFKISSSIVFHHHHCHQHPLLSLTTFQPISWIQKINSLNVDVSAMICTENIWELCSCCCQTREQIKHSYSHAVDKSKSPMQTEESEVHNNCILYFDVNMWWRLTDQNCTVTRVFFADIRPTPRRTASVL